MQPVQIRMARAALNLTIDDLAKQAGVSPDALTALEAEPNPDPEATEPLGLFFASHGIELIDGDGVRARFAQANAFVPVEQLTTDNDGGEG